MESQLAMDAFASQATLAWDTFQTARVGEPHLTLSKLIVKVIAKEKPQNHNSRIHFTVYQVQNISDQSEFCFLECTEMPCHMGKN